MRKYIGYLQFQEVSDIFFYATSYMFRFPDNCIYHLDFSIYNLLVCFIINQNPIWRNNRNIYSIFISLLFSYVSVCNPLIIHIFIKSSILFSPFISRKVTTIPNCNPLPAFGSSLSFVLILSPHIPDRYALRGRPFSFNASLICLTLSHLRYNFLASSS